MLRDSWYVVEFDRICYPVFEEVNLRLRPRQILILHFWTTEGVMIEKFLNLAFLDSKGTGNPKNLDFSTFMPKMVFFAVFSTAWCL